MKCFLNLSNKNLHCSLSETRGRIKRWRRNQIERTSNFESWLSAVETWKSWWYRTFWRFLKILVEFTHYQCQISHVFLDIRVVAVLTNLRRSGWCFFFTMLCYILVVKGLIMWNSFTLELGGLIKFVRPFLQTVSKAKAAKLVRSLVDSFLDMEASTGMEVH